MKNILLTLCLSLGLVFITNAEKWEHSNISSAVFALNVIDRMPQNIINEIDNSVKKIYFYTNFRNLNGQKLKHRWIYNGKNMAEINFLPKADRWRVYSSKNLWRNWTGEWKVEVINEKDEILISKSFIYNKKP